jgi:thymidylate kinase
MRHIQPDLVIILDVDPSIAIKRLKKKKKKSIIKKFEKLDFLKIVRKGFIYFAKKFKWKIIDSSKTIPEVHNEIIKEVLKIL